jgi:hypothetical protein
MPQVLQNSATTDDDEGNEFLIFVPREVRIVQVLVGLELLRSFAHRIRYLEPGLT